MARIPGWTGTGVVPSELGGGITNLNYRVDVGGESFVVRIPGKDCELLGIDRHREHACTLAASRSGVAPEVVQFLEAEGVLVTRFIAGRALSPDEIRQAPVLRRVAATLRRFHGGAPFPGIFSAFEQGPEYPRIRRRAGPVPPLLGSRADQPAA